MLRLPGCIVALMLVSGCSSGMGPDASLRIPPRANAPGSAVNLYWPCPIDVPLPEVLKDHYRVEIDGKDVGEISRCAYARFEVAEGRHAIYLRHPMIPDLAGALGFKGGEYTIPRGAPIYIRVAYFHYVEYHQVPAEDGIREITNMAKS
jgi:hypothetical protein